MNLKTTFKLFALVCCCCLGLSTTAWAQPANDNIADAVAIAVTLDGDPSVCSDGLTISGDNTGATDEAAGALDASCFSGGANDVWFTFTAPASGLVNVDTDFAQNTNGDTEVAVYSYCGAPAPIDITGLTEIGCNQDDGASGCCQSLISNLTVSPGKDYFVQVSGWNGNEGAFCLDVTEVPNVPTCSTPIATLTGPIADCVAGTFTLDVLIADLSSPSVEVFADVDGAGPVSVGSATVCNTNIPAGPFNFDENVTITVVPSDDDGTCTLTAGPLTFSAANCPPANDECADATPVACDDIVNGTTINATLNATTDTDCGGSAADSPTVWYQFAGTGDDITATTCGSAGGDSQLFVYSGDCGTLVC